MTSFYLFKDPFSKYTHIHKYGGLGFQHVNLGEHNSVPNTNQLPEVSVCVCAPMCGGGGMAANTGQEC